MSYFRDFKEIFIFSKDERTMAIVVFVLIFSLTVFNYTNHFWHSAKPISPERIAKANAIARELSENRQNQSLKFFQPRSSSFFDKADIRLFAFDPNTLDSTGWVNLGFTPRQTAGILKYRTKGGLFKKKSDLKKLYCVDDSLYGRLEPYIQLPEEVSFDKETQETPSLESLEKSPESARVVLVELNTADTSDLKLLPGIGSYYARKIVEYRQSLGGYLNVDQLLEIWKFGDERLERISKYIVIDTMYVNKLAINTLDKDALKIHPYVSSQLAYMMVNFRKHHGPFKRPADLKKLVLVNDSIYDKLVPYVDFTP